MIISGCAVVIYDPVESRRVDNAKYQIVRPMVHVQVIAATRTMNGHRTYFGRISRRCLSSKGCTDLENLQSMAVMAYAESGLSVNGAFTDSQFHISIWVYEDESFSRSASFVNLLSAFIIPKREVFSCSMTTQITYAGQSSPVTIEEGEILKGWYSILFMPAYNFVSATKAVESAIYRMHQKTIIEAMKQGVWDALPGNPR